MRVRDLGLLGAMLLAAGVGAARAEAPVYPPGSRFGFEPPGDMVASRRFSGFERREGGATLSVVELPPGAFAELVGGFTDQALLQQGFAVEKREAVKVGEDEGMLYTGDQPGAGAERVRKWILVVGTPTVTGLIIAQALPEAEAADTMRRLVTGVSVRPPLTMAQQIDALPFQLTDTAGFRPVRVMAGNALLMTAGPKDQLQALEQPLLVITEAVQQPPTAEQRDGFARAALYANQTMKDFVIERSQGYRAKGAEWHEIVARAVDTPGDVPVVVSQTIRFTPDGYLRALGVVREDQRAGVLAKFRAVVDGVVLK